MLPWRYSLRNLSARRMASLLTLGGLALVTFVFAAVSMMASGIESSLALSGRRDVLVVLRPGADSEIMSAVDRDTARALGTLPGVRTGTDRQPTVTSEVVVLVALTAADGSATNVTARGVQPASFEVRPDVRLIRGRAPNRGSLELAVGSGLLGRCPGATLGGQLHFAGQTWTVVGELASNGSAFESELWGDADMLGRVFERFSPSSVAVRLESEGSVETFLGGLQAHPELNVKVVREDAYWKSQGEGTSGFLRALGYFVAGVFGLGALVGASITTYAETAARRGELALLRAVGFSKRAVLGAVLVDAALLGLAGGILGLAAASLLSFLQVRTLNFQTFSELRFRFVPTLPSFLASALAALAAGIFGGLLPAVQASRRPILEGLE